MSEDYEYENDHADRFHDYEEDAMQNSHWPADSANDVESEDDYYYTDNLEEGEYDEREDLGWDGGRED